MSINFVKTSSGVVAAATPADGTYVWASDTKKFYRGDGATLGANLIGPSAGGTVGGPAVTVANQIALFSGTNGNLTSAANTGIITASAGVIGSVGTLSVSQGGTGFGTIATNTVMICITANTLTAQSLSASQFIGRKSTGDTGALSAAEARTEIEAAVCSTVSTGGASTSLSKAIHQGKFIACTAATTLTITSVTAFDNWGECTVYAQGGIVTFTTGTATTLSVIGSKPKTLPLYGKASIQKTDAGHVYIATGEMA